MLCPTPWRSDKVGGKNSRGRLIGQGKVCISQQFGEINYDVTFRTVPVICSLNVSGGQTNVRVEPIKIQ